MSPGQQVQRAADALKIFPLPSAVLLPGAALPLHLFEPRYRALVRDALAGDGVLALADLEPGWERDYAGRPPLKPLACAGVIAWHEALPDGRYNILLQGVSRVRILEEHAPIHPYREVRAEILGDPPYEGPLEALLRQAVLEIAGRLSGELGDSLLALASHARGGALADLVTAALVQDLDERKAALEELHPARRLERTLENVGELMARMGAAAPRGPLN